MVLVKMDPKTGEADWSLYAATPYELTNPIGTFQQEAGAKGMALILTVGFITLDEFYGQEEEEQEDDD